MFETIVGGFHWTPTIGDPTVGGWITVVLYFTTVVSCWVTSRAVKWQEGSAGIDADLWQFAAYLFAALGVNKQLDLQTALTEFGRALARAHGWYAQRHDVQIVFVIFILALVAAVAAIMVARMWHAPPAAWMGMLGIAIVLGFVAVRAASIHRVDQFIGAAIAGLKWNWVLEIGGITTVLAASRWRVRQAMAGARGDGRDLAG